MNTPDEKKAVLPKEWGWEKYEPALREQAAQWTRLECGRGSITEAEERHIVHLMLHWAEEQVRAATLPSADEREKKGQPYMDIFAALKREAWHALNEDREDKYKVGLAHWNLDKEKESRPHPERTAPVRSRKDRDDGRER